MTKASLHALSIALAGALGLGLAACPGEEPAGAQCVADGTAPGFDAAAPVSFATDVMPVFKASCAFSTCHGNAAGSANGVFLGGTDAAKVHAGLLAGKATLLPSMALVAPGDPQGSFLIRKVDGTHCALVASCQGGTCGESMPYGGDLLPQQTRDTIRRWVAQGAKND